MLLLKSKATEKDIMQAIERVAPVEVNGIEFYVSNSGVESGLSQAALAKLCSVHDSTMSRFLTVLQNEGVKTLEHLRGNVFHSCITSNQQAKVVKSEVAAEVIEYYAFNKNNPVALSSYRLFAKAGIHTWILHTTGYTATVTQAPVNPVSSIAGLEAMLELAKSHIQQLKNMEDKPGLASIMKDYAQTDYNQLPPARICLRDYLAGKDITLSKSDMGYVSGVVAATYKAHRGTLPNQISVNYITPSGKRANGMVHGYQVDDYALIDASLELLRII